MGQADDAIAYAQAQVGKPYVFATQGPDTFDCSGLIRAAYAHANPPINLPHWTVTQSALGTEVPLSEIQPGDLTFPNNGHVQIFIGGGSVIEAANESTGVIMSPLSSSYWRIRRVTNDGKTSRGVASDTVGNFAPGSIGIPNPLSAAASLVDVFRPVGVAAATVTNINFWRRAGQFVLGSALVIAGIFVWNRRNISDAVSSTQEKVGALVGTAAQGAAFGIGAGGASGGGLMPRATAPISGVPVSRGKPKPPPAVAPATAVPITGSPGSGGGMVHVESKPVHTTPVSHGGRSTVYGTAKGSAPVKAAPLIPSMRNTPFDPNAKGKPFGAAAKRGKK